MNEYALFVDGVLKEIRVYEAKPADIPHKKITWHNVIREYGAPSASLENGNWIIRTVDPSTLPTPVPSSVTAAQIRIFLHKAGMLEGVEAQIASMSKEAQIAWEYSTEVQRASPLLDEVAQVFKLTPEQIDQFFIEAAAL